MEMYMDLGDLRIFRAVVEEGGVTRAAEKLSRVQSNVTTRVRQLEDRLGVALFLREGRQMRLTPEGQVLYGYAGRLLELAEEAEAALCDPTPSGVFRLGAGESTAAVRLPGLLSRFVERWPKVELKLTTGNPVALAAQVLAGGLEAAFFAEPVGDGLDSLPAFVEELVVVTAGGHPPVTPEALPAAILVFEHGCPHRRAIEHLYADCGCRPAQTIEIGSYHAMLGCAVVGMGAALLPRSVLSTFPEAGRLRVHPMPDGRHRLTTRLTWRRGAPSPRVAALAELVAEARPGGGDVDARGGA
jgi:DNA-binding transcriptional LysR family regulator